MRALIQVKDKLSIFYELSFDNQHCVIIVTLGTWNVRKCITRMSDESKILPRLGIYCWMQSFSSTKNPLIFRHMFILTIFLVFMLITHSSYLYFSIIIFRSPGNINALVVSRAFQFSGTPVDYCDVKILFPSIWGSVVMPHGTNISRANRLQCS
jgi:hypothetical protein